jgi:cell division protein FtsI (penicillin-binding protein 3)
MKEGLDSSNSQASRSQRKPAVDLGSSGYKLRLTVLMIGTVGLAIGIVTRAIFIQIFPNERLASMARRQFQSKVLVQPARGSILDRYGEPLAKNIETRSLAVNPSKVLNPKALARLITRALDVPYSKLLKRLSDSDKEFVWIKRHLTDAELERLRKWRVMEADGEMSQGLWLVRESQRVYPHGDLASHLLGSVNIDSEGIEGTELLFNSRLRGQVVSFQAQKDAMGRPTFIDAFAAKDKKDGEAVELTIDAGLQFTTEQALKTAMLKTRARAAAAVVMNAENGEILALANEPTFLPSEKGAPPENRRNRVLTDGYEPGSTLKAVLLASALSHGAKLTDTVYGEGGKFKIGKHWISEAMTHEKFEWLTLTKMIQFSSNVGAAKLALKLGPDHFFATLKSMGFGSKTGIGFPGEISGRILPRKEWIPIATANIGFGQGILTTPMQMLRAYAAFANGGILVQPKVFKTPPAGQVIDPPKRIFSKAVIEQVTEALESVTMEGGTGIKAAIPGYRIAGKTGTAQVIDPKTGRYSRSHYVASFIGYPVEVNPKLVVLTLVDEPKGGYYAAETAVPVFREVLTAAIQRYSLPSDGKAPKILTKEPEGRPSPLNLVEQLREQLKNTPDHASVMGLHGMGPGGKVLYKMPSFKGLTPREVFQLVQNHNIKVEVHGFGITQSQYPTEGHLLSEGDTVRLDLAEP